MLIKNLFKEHSDAKFDRNKAKEIIENYHEFITKNDNHISFFGGNLVGVHPIRFTPRDKDILVEDICEIYDYDEYADALLDLRSLDDPKEKLIVSSRKVQGNPINYLYFYLGNGIYESNLPIELKKKAMIATYNMLQIKYLTSLDSEYFTYNGDEAIAHAMYEKLSKKSLIKALGSWRAVIEYRSENFIKTAHNSKEDRLYHGCTDMKNDDFVIYAVSEIQNRVRKSYINLTCKFHNNRDLDNRIQSRSAVMTVEGEKVIREYQNDTAYFIQTLGRTLRDPNAFIKKELIDETLKLVNTTNETNLRNTLDFIVNNIGGSKKFDIEPELTALVGYIFEYIKKQKFKSNDLPTIIDSLRNAYRSHMTSHDVVIDIKDKLDDIVKRAIKANHAATRSGTKVATLVYVTLRILTIPHYD